MDTMPYCPKCNMEFIDGITVCSDCGGPLAESKEAADAMKRQQRQEELDARRLAQYREMMGQYREMMEGYQAMQETSSHAGPETLAQYQEMMDHYREMMEGYQAMQETCPHAGAETVPLPDGVNVPAGPPVDGAWEMAGSPLAVPVRKGRTGPSQVYVKKSQKYDDLKSSASAFLLVGGVLTVAAVLFWSNMLHLPMNDASRLITQSVVTVMGIASLVVAFTSLKSAKAMKGEIAQEETDTRRLVDWFVTTWRKEELDARIARESGDLTPEETSLKRFDLIQDILVTSHDLPDQSYVDLLAEEIYTRLYEEQ